MLTVTNKSVVMLALVPQLAITQSVNTTQVADGYTILVTMNIFHTPVSDVDALNVVVTNSLPQGLQYIEDSYQFIFGERPDAFGAFASKASIIFNTTGLLFGRSTVDEVDSVLAWHIPAMPLGNVSVIEFMVEVRVALINKTSPVLEMLPEVLWSSIPAGPALWHGNYSSGVAGSPNSTFIFWEPLPIGTSLCIGGVIMAGAALTLGYRGGVFANDGWVFTFLYIIKTR